MSAYRILRKSLRPVRRVWNDVHKPILGYAHKLVFQSYAHKLIFGNPREHLERSRGVIHVGANMGAERDIYAEAGLRVFWIEPIPAIYQALAENIAAYPDQAAVQALITDTDGDEKVLHVANNEGQSSSIFDLHLHRDIWPDIGYVQDILLKTETLPTALSRSGVRVEDYDALVLDTQGSELLILKGAATLLPNFRYIVAEAADFEAYKGGAMLDEIKTFLRPFGFRAINHKLQFVHPDGGRYYDVLFRNT